jgi:futalosine hydrolase
VSSATELLVCAATTRELSAFGPDAAAADLSQERFFRHGARVSYLLTGVGIPSTYRHLLPLLARGQCRPGRILNLGIAGAYPGSGLRIGDIVMADSEVFGDLGFELPEPPGFRPVAEAPFGGFYAAPLALYPDPAFRGAAAAAAAGLRRRCRIARGCTVNTCTGSDATGRLREGIFQAGFETMEGAAVAQIGGDLGIPVCELRAISNIAARRDMRPENVARALENLGRYLAACREDRVPAPPASAAEEDE